MFVHQTRYDINLHTIQSLRFTLLSLYDPYLIQSLEEIIRRYIECLDISYNHVTYSFIIRIKKTSMKRIKGFKQEVLFYYWPLKSAFEEFLKSNFSYITKKLLDIQGIEGYQNFIDTMNTCTNIDNLFNIYCIGNNTIEIKL